MYSIHGSVFDIFKNILSLITQPKMTEMVGISIERAHGSFGWSVALGPCRAERHGFKH